MTVLKGWKPTQEKTAKYETLLQTSEKVLKLFPLHSFVHSTKLQKLNCLQERLLLDTRHKVLTTLLGPRWLIHVTHSHWMTASFYFCYDCRANGIMSWYIFCCMRHQQNCSWVSLLLERWCMKQKEHSLTFRAQTEFAALAFGEVGERLLTCKCCIIFVQKQMMDDKYHTSLYILYTLQTESHFDMQNQEKRSQRGGRAMIGT